MGMLKGLKRSLSLGLSMMLLTALPAFSCGPFFDEACFTYTLHPDLPLKLYAQGNLGLLQPTYARSYLVVAYRYLKGGALSESERQQALNLWKFRLGTPTDGSAAKSQEWLKLRAKTMDAFHPKPAKSKDDTWEYF